MGTWPGTREEAIEYLQWWAHPELDSARTPITVEHVAVRELLTEVEELRAENEQMLQQHADEVMALDRVRALVESDRDADGNVGILPRWSSTELERVLEGS